MNNNEIVFFVFESCFRDPKCAFETFAMAEYCNRFDQKTIMRAVGYFGRYRKYLTSKKAIDLEE